jgi:hypothetical protein
MNHNCVLPKFHQSQPDTASDSSAPHSAGPPLPANPGDPEWEAAADDYAQYHRCWHRTMSGRRCRQPIYDPNTYLCRKHARIQNTPDKEGFIADLSPFLTANPRSFDDLEGVHSFLSSLAVLLAQNRVSTRRAAVLSYICTQLIRTNLAIEKRDAHDADYSLPPDFKFRAPLALNPPNAPPSTA